ncbi:hypothetical protein LSAT2_004258 [Lamellibrachia satsuma]|nr:hypothetical protein LSAT2_004258 [Lamellibrachia satsuma]
MFERGILAKRFWLCLWKVTAKAMKRVVHDCRKISDMLWYQYQVQMVNVFDTQVADLNVYQLRHRGDLPYYAKSLSVCLFEHLNLTTEQVFIYKIHEESLKATFPSHLLAILSSCPDVIVPLAPVAIPPVSLAFPPVSLHPVSFAPVSFAPPPLSCRLPSRLSPSCLLTSCQHTSYQPPPRLR